MMACEKWIVGLLIILYGLQLSLAEKTSIKVHMYTDLVRIIGRNNSCVMNTDDSNNETTPLSEPKLGSQGIMLSKYTFIETGPVRATIGRCDVTDMTKQTLRVFNWTCFTTGNRTAKGFNWVFVHCTNKSVLTIDCLDYEDYAEIVTSTCQEIPNSQRCTDFTISSSGSRMWCSKSFRIEKTNHQTTVEEDVFPDQWDILAFLSAAFILVCFILAMCIPAEQCKPTYKYDKEVGRRVPMQIYEMYGESYRPAAQRRRMARLQKRLSSIGITGPFMKHTTNLAMVANDPIYPERHTKVTFAETKIFDDVDMASVSVTDDQDTAKAMEISGRIFNDIGTTKVLNDSDYRSDNIGKGSDGKELEIDKNDKCIDESLGISATDNCDQEVIAEVLSLDKMIQHFEQEIVCNGDKAKSENKVVSDNQNCQTRPNNMILSPCISQHSNDVPVFRRQSTDYGTTADIRHNGLIQDRDETSANLSDSYIPLPQPNFTGRQTNVILSSNLDDTPAINVGAMAVSGAEAFMCDTRKEQQLNLVNISIYTSSFPKTGRIASLANRTTFDPKSTPPNQRNNPNNHCTCVRRGSTDYSLSTENSSSGSIVKGFSTREFLDCSTMALRPKERSTSPLMIPNESDENGITQSMKNEAEPISCATRLFNDPYQFASSFRRRSNSNDLRVPQSFDGFRRRSLTSASCTSRESRQYSDQSFLNNITEMSNVAHDLSHEIGPIPSPLSEHVANLENVPNTMRESTDNQSSNRTSNTFYNVIDELLATRRSSGLNTMIQQSPRTIRSQRDQDFYDRVNASDPAQDNYETLGKGRRHSTDTNCTGGTSFCSDTVSPLEDELLRRFMQTSGVRRISKC